MLPRLNAVLERFQNESQTRLDDPQLDSFTQELWRHMNWKQRVWTGVAPAGLLFAPLLAVMMIPMDFGGSTVLVFASMKELLFAGVAGLGMAMMNSDHMPLVAEREAAWQQLSDLVAIGCDEFGLPRVASDAAITLEIENESKPLSYSQLASRPSSVGASELFEIHRNSAFDGWLEQIFQRLDAAIAQRN
jgi:hypothetical protein